MQPVQITLKNFTSYKDETVNFDGFDIAVATGENGAGKSSLVTDSITWCLFGEGSKGGKKNMNDYIKRGEQEGRVELQFRLGKDLYRVVRHRSTVKDKTLLEFFVADTDLAGNITWIPRSGKSIAETQEIIENTLRMDYRTFTSSSLILQGKADSFTSDMTDAERKEALARILGLDIWDQLQEKVKASIKQIREKLVQTTAKKEPLLERIESGKTVQEQLDSTQVLLKECEDKMESLQAAINEINAQLSKETIFRNKLDDLIRKKESLESEQQKIMDEINAHSGKITRINLVLENKENVLKAVEDEKLFSEKIVEIEKELAKKPLLEQQKDDLEKKIANAEAEISKLKSESFNIDINLMELQNILAKKDDILDACEQENNLAAELQEHEQASKRYMELSKSMEAVYKQASDWKAKYDAEIASINSEIQAKQPLVKTLSNVPCSGDEKQTCPLLASARAAADDIEALKNKLATESAKTNPFKEEYLKLSEERKLLNYDSSKHTACKNLLEEIRKTSSLKPKLDAAEVRKAELEKRDAEIKQRIKEIGVTEEQKFKLAVLISQLTLLSNKEKILPDYRQKLTEAQNLAQHKAELDKLEALLPEVTALLDSAKSKLDQVSSEISDTEKAMHETELEIKKIGNIALSLQEKKSQMQSLKADESMYRICIGRYEQCLKDAATAQKELDAIEVIEKDLRSQLSTYELLEQACGKKSGVPALIIENAVPEIERLANDMLNRITGGRMQLRLDTQVEGKSTGTMQDVLRITIMDAGLPGPYQTYSGAEKFKIDISLRIAISKFLAHRAGAEIKLLVIDEGFGSLDASGRQDILNVINAVRQDFSKVIIITHLEELKDAFSRRIEVTKGPDGSKVHIA